MNKRENRENKNLHTYDFKITKKSTLDLWKFKHAV